jgi:hypothetical protein
MASAAPATTPVLDPRELIALLLELAQNGRGVGFAA